MNPVCHKLKNISFTGNVIPVQWYASIIRESGKPDSVAVPILADILYWYRPAEVRDERSGQVSHYKQKFSDDKLRKSYQEYADLFGFSKRQVKDAIDNLIRLDLVTREFRDVKLQSGYIVRNVIYLEPVPEKIFEITNIFQKDVHSVKSDNNDTEYSEKAEHVLRKNGIPYSEKTEDGVTKKRNTYHEKTDPHHYTYNTAETTKKNTAETTANAQNAGILKNSEQTARLPDHSPQIAAAAAFYKEFSELANQIPVAISDQRKDWLVKHIETYGYEYILEKIAYANSRVKDKRKYWAYLGKSIDHNYGVGFLEESEVQRKAEARTMQEKARREAEKRAQEQLEKERIEQEREISQAYANVFLNLPEPERESIRTEYLAYLKNKRDFMLKKEKPKDHQQLAESPTFRFYLKDNKPALIMEMRAV